MPLAPLDDPQLVLPTVAQALGAEQDVAEHIADRSLLLVLDNFEHLTDAADDVAALLTACPRLHVLVTSREVLRLPGEQAYPVTELRPEEGVELFLSRALAADPSFASTDGVAALCARLEQLPLALELAAARVRVLSPAQLLDRLSSRLDLLKAGRGVDPRQQTLRATIEWSHELLDADEQQAFARLAVFAGGWTLLAAEAVTDADLDVAQSLVDKSLVRARERDRFFMLETIREFAAEQLDRSADADDVRRRHAAHFLAFAEAAAPALEDDRQDEWFELRRGRPAEPPRRARLEPRARARRRAPDRGRAQGVLVRARLPERGAALARRRPRRVRRAHADPGARADRRVDPRLDPGRLARDEALRRREPRARRASSATPGSRASRC